MNSKRNKTLKILTAFFGVACLVLSMLALRSFAALRYGNSQDLDLEMSSVEVFLVENGNLTTNQDDALLSSLKGKSLDPGYGYKETIAARNTGKQPEYVRVIVHKYWMDQDGNKLPDLDPSLIDLTYGDKAYNDDAWIINDAETTSEQTVYYLKKTLAARSDSALLFDQIGADASLMDAYTLNNTLDENGQTITAVYDYDGLQIGLDIEVQSLQHKHGDKAVPSAWGVTNVTASDGTISVSR